MITRSMCFMNENTGYSCEEYTGVCRKLDGLHKGYPRNQKSDGKSDKNTNKSGRSKSGISDSGKPNQVLSVWVSRWQHVDSENQSSRTNQSQSSQ